MTNSIKMNADFRSATHLRNLQSGNSTIVKRPGSHPGCRTTKFMYPSFENSRYQRRLSEETIAPVYKSIRSSRSFDIIGSAFPKPSSRGQNINKIQDRKHRSSEKTRLPNTSCGDNEHSPFCPRSEDSSLVLSDQSTPLISTCCSRGLEKSSKRQDRIGRSYSKDAKKRSPRSCNSPSHRNNQNHSYCRRQRPQERLKISEWLPGCRLQNIEARGGKRDFRKWFMALPPHVLVDKDVRTDRGVFKKDTFQTSQALDNYLGIETNISSANHQDYNLRSPE